MFQFSGFPTYGYVFTIRCYQINDNRFPHSEIRASMDICSLTRLIAACHVLLRLLMPRHSSYALISLTLSQLALIAPSCTCARLHFISRLFLFPKNSTVSPFSGALSCSWLVTLMLNDLSFSLSFPYFYVSKSCKVFRYQCVFNTF